MDIIYLIIALVVGFLIALIFSYLKFKSDSSRIEERSKIHEESKNELESKLEIEQQESREISSKLASLQADYSYLQQKLKENKDEVEQLQEKFTKEFENLANKIFDEKTKTFSEQSKTNLKEILNPLKDRITEFQTKVEETNKDSISRNAALRQQLQSLKDMNQQMSTDANNLVKALKGDTIIRYHPRRARNRY